MTTEKKIQEYLALLIEYHTSAGKNPTILTAKTIHDLITVAHELLESDLDTSQYPKLIPNINIYLELFQKILTYNSMPVSKFFQINNNIIQLLKDIIPCKTSVNSTQKEIIFFLPYKLSMWDSLESVWKRAESDENCEAFVMPIPYYDRNNDGTLGQYHWEAPSFPKNVPVIDYHKINLKEIHPNKIYIHNPYDECNYVTSIDPAYYSKNLREYTDELIYIPYFVEDETNVTPEGIAHFVVTPGVVYAHKVIVQSEKYKQCYVQALVNHFGESCREHFNKTILGLGSPKLEKVRNTKKEDVDIPDEWMKLILKPDGSWKKIILYNNSVGTLVRESDKIIEKYKWALKIFKERSKDICLLWRPHPLIEATISSMHPELWASYQSIVDKYKKEAWGIYDDTPDLHRAIALCDAYYGDTSSVVKLVQEAGKVCMIQNVDVIN